MKLSVITINRNNRSGLEQTLRSSLGNQPSFNDWEQIVIDGASTDRSIEALSEYRDSPRLGFSVSEPDSGIYNAMNKGAAHARGEYLMFLNSGDELLPDVLQKVFSATFSEDLVYGDIVRPVARKDVLHQMPSPDEIVPAFFLFTSLPHQATFIRKDCLDRFGGYDESYALAGDADFFLKAVVAKCRLRHVPFPVSRFYYGGVSNNSTLLERWIRERTAFLAPVFGREVAQRASYPSVSLSFISPVVSEAARRDAALACVLSRFTSAIVAMWRYHVPRAFFRGVYRLAGWLKRK